VDRLREFWETICATSVNWPASEGLMEGLPFAMDFRSTHNMAAAMRALLMGQSGFFKPRFPPPFLSLFAGDTATSFYDTAPLRDTLKRLVDFDRLNSGDIRVSVGAVNIRSGNLVYFDTAERRLRPEHFMASGALPPGFPAIEIDGDAIHVEDRGVWTSAGVTAGMDLALAMIEADHGRDVALAIARRHVVFRIRPGGQSQFSSELAAQSSRNAKTGVLAEKIAASPQNDWKTDVLAQEAGISQRSLSRLFRSSLNVSPADFVERVRIDLARRRLLETADNVETIAFNCGFGSLRRMDRAFARIIGVSPTEFRARFKTNGDRKCRSSISALSFSPN